MYESHEEYKVIVQREVQLLEKRIHRRILNGEQGTCPRCGRDGIWDVATKGFIHHLGNSIYYSTVFNQWRCGVCDDPTVRVEEGRPRGAFRAPMREQFH